MSGDVFPNTRNVVVVVPILDDDDAVVDVEEIPILGWRLRDDLQGLDDAYTLAEPVLWDRLDDTDWVIYDRENGSLWVPRGCATDWREGVVALLRRRRRENLPRVKQVL